MRKLKRTFHYNKNGYPVSNKDGKLIHRKVAEKIIGRKIDSRREEVHHKDHNSKNFRKNNLVVLSRKTHRRGHRQGWL